MSKEQKKTYIWDYYRYHILIGCGLILLVSYLGYEYVNRTNEVFSVAILDSSSFVGTDLVAFEKELVPVVVEKANERDEARVFVYPLEDQVEDANMMSSPYQEKLMINLVAGEIDLLFFDETQLSWLEEQELLQPLDNKIDLSKFDSSQLVIDKVTQQVSHWNKNRG